MMSGGKPISAWVLLGVGARGRAFRGCRYELPFGWIGWIRWRDAEWPEKRFPTAHYEPDDPWRSPEEMSEEYLDLAPAAGRLVVHIDQDPAPWDSAAQAASAVSDLLHSLDMPTVVFGVERGLAGLDQKMLSAGEVCPQDIPWENAPDHIMSFEWEELLHSWFYSSDDALQHNLNLCNPILRDGDGRRWGLFPALIYHRLSLTEFGFIAPDDVQEVIGEHDYAPESPFHKARAEEGFLNAFKAIEAVLGGELSNSPDRLDRRLGRRGIDPTTDPRFPDGTKRTLAERLHRLSKIRDERSAHGGRSSAMSRHLSYHDIVEAQWIALALVSEVLIAGGHLDRESRRPV
jgi:hypothetical protein